MKPRRANSSGASPFVCRVGSRWIKTSFPATSILNMTIPDSPVSALPAETQADLEDSYVHLRFRGGRFEGAEGMPMAAMSEMTYLNDLIIEVARIIWRRQSGKKRTHDFPEAPILRVKRFLKGSQIPRIERDGPSSVLTGDPFDVSRDLVERTFWTMIGEAELPKDFPLECVDELRRIGKTLDAGEAAEFLQKDENGQWQGRSYTRKVRQDFWAAFDKPTHERQMLVGQVQSLNRKARSFSFKRLSGQVLEAKFHTQGLWDDLHEALGKAESHPFCRIATTVEMDYLNRVRKVLETHNVEVIEVNPIHWEGRFAELAAYGENWIPGAIPVTSDSLERADALMHSAYDLGLPLPTLFASTDGGMNLVWESPSGRTTVYVEPDEPYEVERVPDGPLVPFSSEEAETAVRHALGLISG